MPDMPNWQEFGSAGQQSQKDVTELYDARYGRHKDEAVRDDKKTKPLPAEPSPISIGGNPY
jgi:hypothetical protein